MEENLNTIELNEMKEQISLLRRKLEKETIVNEKLIRASMRDKLKAVKRRSYILCIVGIAAAALWKFGVSPDFNPLFIDFTAFFLLFAAAYEVYCNRMLSAQNYIEGNLVDEARKLNRYKELARQWYWFSIPIVCVWSCWYLYESYTVHAEQGRFLFIWGIIGGTIGGVIGWRIYRKGQKAINEVIEQIEELTGEKE
jgi:hypothetical protein